MIIAIHLMRKQHCFLWEEGSCVIWLDLWSNLMSEWPSSYLHICWRPAGAGKTTQGVEKDGRRARRMDQGTSGQKRMVRGQERWWIKSGERVGLTAAHTESRPPSQAWVNADQWSSWLRFELNHEGCWQLPWGKRTANPKRSPLQYSGRCSDPQATLHITELPVEVPGGLVCVPGFCR